MSEPEPQATAEQETEPAPTPGSEHDEQTELLIEDEVLVEDVSIDGMCGVY